jgi:hypothetical protein
LVQVLMHATHALVAELQNCPVPHATAGAKERQPLASAVHVCTWVPEHCVAPTVEQAL